MASYEVRISNRDFLLEHRIDEWILTERISGGHFRTVGKIRGVHGIEQIVKHILNNPQHQEPGYLNLPGAWRCRNCGRKFERKPLRCGDCGASFRRMEWYVVI